MPVVKKITQTTLDTLPIPPKGSRPYEVWERGSGLGVASYPSGKWAWQFKGSINGRQVKKVLKGVGTVTEAGDRVKEIKGLAVGGRDYFKEQEREAEKPELLHGPLFHEFLNSMCGWKLNAYGNLVSIGKSNHPDNNRRFLLKSLACLHGVRVDTISPADVEEALNKVGGSSANWNRARSALSAFYAWCIRKTLITHNSAHAVKKKKERKVERPLYPHEIVRLMTYVRSRDDEYHAIIEIALRTGCRRGEVGGARWSELSFIPGNDDQGRPLPEWDIETGSVIWTVPEERTKNGEPLKLDLPKQVAQLFLSRSKVKGRDFIFGNNGEGYSGFSKSKKRFDEACPLDQPWRFHDLRHTFVTHMVGSCKIPPHIVEAVVNHQSGHKAGVAGAYNHAAYPHEKKAALKTWSDWIDHIARLNEQPEGEAAD